MKKGVLFSIIVSALLVSCKIIQPVNPETIYGDGTMTFKFIQLNDVYEIAPLNGGQYGGLARVAHIRDSIARENPNTYLFMAGDFLNPSLLGTLSHNGETIHGKQMIDVMNAMDFDLVTFGNHEFDIGEEDLQKRLNESNFQWVSSNVRHATEGGLKPFKKDLEFGSLPVPDYFTIPVRDTLGNEIKIGFFSVTLDSNPQDFVYYGDVYESADKAYRLVKDKADIIFGLTHLTIDQDRKLAKRLPLVPLIMGGHEHSSMLIREGRSLITKADANAKTVYVHTITYDLITNYVHVHSKLVPIDSKIPSQPAIDRIVKKWTEVLEEKVETIAKNPNEIIYVPKTPLDGTDSANRNIQTNLGELITNAMLLSFNHNVDAAIVNGGSIRVDDIMEGPLTSQDVFRILPFGGPVLKVDMKGSLLRAVLEYGKASRGTGAYLQRYHITESATGDWLLRDKSIQDNTVYTIALSDFLMKGYDIPFLTPSHPGVIKVYEPEISEPATDIRKAVILFMKNQPTAQ
ncbi:MAG: bifunctional metallophosphatase/5'-nucleotidase [Flavobacteriaceae bacterium]|nr:bifunctional metallophosphatase/5'-nucleotidase [Flavobacteriaceae bacterium]